MVVNNARVVSKFINARPRLMPKMEIFLSVQSVISLLFLLFQIISAQCPPKNVIPQCDCSPGNPDSGEKLRVVCDGLALAEVSSKFKNLGPLDLTVKNGEFTALSSDNFRDLNVGKLALINNGLERIEAGSFKGSSPNLRGLLIKDGALQAIDDLAFNDIVNVQNITICDAHSLERFPKLNGFPALTAIGFVNTSARYLEAGFLADLPNLREISLQNNKIEIFDMRTFAGLPNVTKLDLSGNALSDVSFLPLVLRSLPALNFLFLHLNKIQTIPEGFLDGLPSILLIDLRHNQIAKLPDHLVTAASSPLRELYLGQNYITELPPQIFENVTVLKTLSLVNNSINTLNMQLAPLKELLYLRLEGNRLQRIAGEAFRTLSRLQILSLENNQLTVLENGVFTGNEALQTIDLSRNYLQDFHGTEIKNLPNLENLLFTGNRLRNLYAGFDSLVKLKRLDLSNNQISNIDENTFANLKSLENLQLDGNLFMKIPLSALQKLPVLERLTMSRNRIHFLPAFKAIGHLKHLALDHNVLQNIDAGIFSQLSDLRQLLLNGNRISVLQPGAFANLYTLYVLDLSDNIVETIPAKVFDNLVSLETLDLSSNDLEKLYDDTLGNLPSLRSVDFSENHITAVADKAFGPLPHLMQLNISHNLINWIPSSIGGLEKLRKLDLSYNRIRRVEDTNLAGLQKLESLFIQRNPVCFLGQKVFTKLSQLNTIDLSYTDVRHLPQSSFKQEQDFSAVNLDGNTIECDCNITWLRNLKPDLRCGYPGSLSSTKISQVNPNNLPCLPDDHHSSDECTVLPILTRPPRTGTAAPLPATPFTTESPEEQILARGSATQTWLTQSEHKEKIEELAAIQAAKQTRNTSSSALPAKKIGAFFLLLAFVLRVINP